MEQLLKILDRLHPGADYAKAEDLYGEGLLDSLDMVRLVTEINQTFDVSIPAEELVPENFRNVNTIYALIQRLDEE